MVAFTLINLHTWRHHFSLQQVHERQTCIEKAATMQQSSQSLGDPLEELLKGSIDSVEYSGGQVICNAPRRNRIYLPGSFNPLHDGHK